MWDDVCGTASSGMANYRITSHRITHRVLWNSSVVFRSRGGWKREGTHGWSVLKLHAIDRLMHPGQGQGYDEYWIWTPDLERAMVQGFPRSTAAGWLADGDRAGFWIRFGVAFEMEH